MDILNAAGQRLGDVEHILRGQDNRVYVVVSHGGFLGLGEKRVALPLDRTALHDGKLVVQGLTVDQIRAMPAFDPKDPRYREAEASFAAPVRVAAIPPAQPSSGAAGMDAAERRRLARERIGEDVHVTSNVGASSATRQQPTRTVRAAELEDLDIYNGQGQVLGDIERVIVNPADNRQYAVIGRGGFLGLFEEEVALPVNRLAAQGDRLMIRGITDSELDDLPGWRNRFANARELDDSAPVSVPVAQ
jgi:sporulation protein YlmC with PRC-barrel domain